MTIHLSKLQRISVLLMAFVLVTMAACSSSSSANALVGKWKEVDRGEIMEFMADNKLSVTAMGMTMNGKYELVGKDKMKVSLDLAEMGMPEGAGDMTVGYTVSGDDLTFIAENGDESKYKREK